MELEGEQGGGGREYCRPASRKEEERREKMKKKEWEMGLRQRRHIVIGHTN